MIVILSPKFKDAMNTSFMVQVVETKSEVKGELRKSCTVLTKCVLE